ncbi:MAG: dehydrogenase [Candidatus Taylorbacteria bacterium]
MLIRSRAPLRLGLAGGGTDVSPYSDIHGGYVLNMTIDMYAYCTIEPTSDDRIFFVAADLEENFEVGMIPEIPIDDNLILHKGVYNYIVKNHNSGKPLSLKMTTYADSPIGSGLGTSSTLVVAMLKAYQEWLKLSFGEYDLAHIAFEIERVQLGLAGGKQDQFSAAFGGINFMEFGKDNVLINPLKIRNWVVSELESSLLLYYMGKSRESAKIIDEQVKGATENNESAIGAMHEVKRSALLMKEAILKGDFNLFVKCLTDGWVSKKKMASTISNSEIEGVHDFVMKNGARAAKVSGAGGGGFMMIYCDPLSRPRLIRALKAKTGRTVIVKFSFEGAQSWVIN